MSNKLPYLHLLYVREYSIDDNSYNMVIYGVNTEDIFHTMGEYVFQKNETLEKIDQVECTQEKVDYWLKNGFRIYNFKDKYV